MTADELNVPSSMADDDDDRAFASVENANEIEALFVQNAMRSSYSNGQLKLSGIGETTLVFSDRPDRVTGHVPTGEFVASWGEGDHSFASDPPNAVLSTFHGDEVNDVVVILRAPEFSGGELTYDVEVLDGDMPESAGANSLFIDTIGRPLTPLSVAGVRRRGRRRGRRRMRRRGIV